MNHLPLPGNKQTPLLYGTTAMRRLLVALCLLAATLWSASAFAQARNQLGPLCTTDTTPADQMIDACSKIIALKVFKGEQLATVYFWRAVGWNKKGEYLKVITDATEAIRLQPSQAVYNLRGSAYYDRGEYEIAIADFDDALKLGPPSGTIFHNRGNAWRGKGDYAKAIADYDMSIKTDPRSAFSYQNRGIAKEALGDLDGALADINQAIRLDPTLPQPLINRTAIWRVRGDYDRAIVDGSEAIRLAKEKPPVNIMTPPNSVLVSGYTHRALAYEAKADYAHASDDYKTTLAIAASVRCRQQGQSSHRKGAAVADHRRKRTDPARCAVTDDRAGKGTGSPADGCRAAPLACSGRARHTHGADHWQWRLCTCQGAAQSAQ